MRKLTKWSRLAAVAVLGTLGCKSLEVVNPNAPDADRAFSDPGAVAGLVSGAMRNWVFTRQAYDGGLVLSSMADTYSASWNNFNLRYYTSYNSDCPNRCAWDNTPSSPFRFQIETYWYGYYSLLSAVNDVLKAIRINGVDVGGAANTHMLESVAVMLQGVVFAQIALNYDQGFIVTEETDLSDLANLEIAPRGDVRDEAITKFNEAIALMTANPFTATPSTWLGVVNGPQYSSAQLIRLIHTMQAELLANYPRNPTENGQVNWAQVATYASGGISSGTPFSFQFYQDNVTLWDGMKNWGNSIFTVRVDTRLARPLTAGPNAALQHRDPWVGPDPQPDAFDQRLGDGSWGPEDDFSGAGTVAETPNAGSEYAFAALNFMNPSRGTYHFGNLIHIRYSYLASPGSGLPDDDGTGLAPIYSPEFNDLLWAEALLRSGGSAATAAGLINKTRVTKGGLSTLTGAEGTTALLAAVQYENDVELLGEGPDAFYQHRRLTPDNWKTGDTCPILICLWFQTPRQMPIPAKELGVLKKELYTFGGANNPAFAPSYDSGQPIFSVRDIWDAKVKEERAIKQARRRF